MIHYDNWPLLWKSIWSAWLRHQDDVARPSDEIPGPSIMSRVEEALLRDGFLHRETQETAGKWCIETFPEYNTLENRSLAILEETVELAVATGGFTPDQIREAVNAVLTKCSLQAGSVSVPEEAGDVLLCLYALAVQQKFDVHHEADRKMQINRSRPLEYYQEKTRQKRKAGLRLEREQRQETGAKAAYGLGDITDNNSNKDGA